MGAASPRCQTPHGHTWWVEITLARGDGGLDSAGMLAEFGAAKAWLKTWVDETLDHSFFHNFNDPLLPALKEHIPGFRGLPFPEDPTTEWITYLISRKVRTHLAHAGHPGDGAQQHLVDQHPGQPHMGDGAHSKAQAQPSSTTPHPGDGAQESGRLLELTKVLVEETPTNSLVWEASKDEALDQLLASRLELVQGWWDSADPYNRFIEPVKP